MRLIDLIVNIFGMLYEQNILPWGNIIMIACAPMSMIISFVIMKKKMWMYLLWKIYNDKSFNNVLQSTFMLSHIVWGLWWTLTRVVYHIISNLEFSVQLKK